MALRFPTSATSFPRSIPLTLSASSSPTRIFLKFKLEETICSVVLVKKRSTAFPCRDSAFRLPTSRSDKNRRFPRKKNEWTILPTNASKRHWGFGQDLWKNNHVRSHTSWYIPFMHCFFWFSVYCSISEGSPHIFYDPLGRPKYYYFFL